MIIVRTETPGTVPPYAVTDAPWTKRCFAHQQQPTKTSCGPTTIAMLVGKPVREILDLLPSVRTGKRSRMTKTHRTNVGELARLAALDGYRLGKRHQGWPPDNVTAVVRLARKYGRRGWHWMLWDSGSVHDPLDIEAERHPKIRWETARVSYYEVHREG